jgi:ATP-binding protein involved in chromosome partitioning
MVLWFHPEKACDYSIYKAPIEDMNTAKNIPVGSIPNVKHIVAVASGKGGVGKSTTTVNLALAMASIGIKVGVLDADIYGPSVPKMLGVDGARPEVVDNKFMLPIMAHGIPIISMANLVTEKTPMVWRGPMASGALLQLITQTQWPELDCLLIDMPPGTGDVQLTLSQKIAVNGAVIVTTPQDIALLDARKAIEMFRKVEVPVLGVVENMAVHVCSECGHTEHVFGRAGGARMAKEYEVELLGSLPLDIEIRQQADSGVPLGAVNQSSAVVEDYKQMALLIQGKLSGPIKTPAPSIIISDD